MGRIKLDLHDIYNDSRAIDNALEQAFRDVLDKKIKELEIIPGKGSGQLRRKVERFLQLPHIKPVYHRIENDSKNFGRLFVYFKFWTTLMCDKLLHYGPLKPSSRYEQPVEKKYAQ